MKAEEKMLKKNKMRALVLRVLILIIAITVSVPIASTEAAGESGYEGGISSGLNGGKTVLDYKEICFITGEPIVLEGTLTLRKTTKQSNILSTYTYSLKNIEKNATLTRTVIYETKVTKKENGQEIEETVLNGTPRETLTVRTNNTTLSYTLIDWEFTKSTVKDLKPAVNYYAGNLLGRKMYQIGAAANNNTVTVVTTGEIYGYDQYWSNAEAISLNYYIECSRNINQKREIWGGEASVTISSSLLKQIGYFENIPGEISFEGGYGQTQMKSSVMEYTCKLPEFDKNGMATDVLKETKDSLRVDGFPVFQRMPVANLQNIRGHWVENEIRQLFGLEILTGDPQEFNPDRYMTRLAFTEVLLNAAKEVPVESALINKTAYVPPQTVKKTNQVITSPFKDIDVGSAHFEVINNAFKRGLLSGKGNDTFGPDEYITKAEVVTALIRAIGLENLAPSSQPVTAFKDNDDIPDYAKAAAYVAAKIGLVQPDENGKFNPWQVMTNAKASQLIMKFVDYLSNGIIKDYRDRFINY
jgi:N-acetylmuramoyl-L-alanine amidase